MPTYTVTVRNLDHSPVLTPCCVSLTARVTSPNLAHAVRHLARELIGRPLTETATVGSVALIPSPMAPGSRPSSRQAIVRCRDGCYLAHAWFARADGKPFPAIR